MSENKNFFRASAEDFKKIPGSPVAYWLKGQDLFLRTKVGDLYISGGRNKTHGNELYLRNWWEPSFKSTRWMVYANGGEFRKYFGNEIDVVDWSEEARSSYESHGGLVNKKFWGHQGICWSLITSASTSFRIKSAYAQYSSGSPTLFDEHLDFSFETLAYLNSPIVRYFLKALNPTINTTFNDVATLPYAPTRQTDISDRVYTLVSLSRKDWDAYERSRNFTVNPLVAARNVSGASDESEFQLSALYAAVREKWAKDCEEMRRLETENNRIFIEAYGLQDELTPEVPWHEITLTCNPWYRYSAECGVQSAELPRDGKLEERLKGDTVKELISYAVGCMMGRYSLEKPGLILADQGATLADYWEKEGRSNSDSSEATLTLRQTSEMRNVSGASDKSELLFEPDDDGIIPILDNDWFADDIVTRFKEFIKVAFGEVHFFENMAWIEEALGKNLRDYFTKDFYKDHLQRYQNRPIYWLFQSPKGAFRALVYMHRYKPDMVGGVLGYLRSLQTKVENQLGVAMQIASDESKSNSERVRANKDVVKFSKAKKELDEYEKNVLYPLSTERIEIDLDDGVKVNYAKFASALAKVKALEAKE